MTSSQLIHHHRVSKHVADKISRYRSNCHPDNNRVVEESGRVALFCIQVCCYSSLSDGAASRMSQSYAVFR